MLTIKQIIPDTLENLILAYKLDKMIMLIVNTITYGDNVLLNNETLWDDYKLLSHNIKELYTMLPNNFLLLNLN